MGKPNRIRKVSVFGAVEGDSEAIFLEYVKTIYFNTTKMNMPDDSNCGGGNPDIILDKALKKIDRNTSFAWIDEDIDLSQESRKKLVKPWNLNDDEEVKIIDVTLGEIQNRFNPHNRNPVLIVSQPVCFEGFICRVLDIECKHKSYNPSTRETQITDLKTAANLGTTAGHFAFYKKNIDKDKLEEKRKVIPELDLLIKMISV